MLDYSEIKLLPENRKWVKIVRSQRRKMIRGAEQPDVDA
jgi:hypothetical protein